MNFFSLDIWTSNHSGLPFLPIFTTFYQLFAFTFHFAPPSSIFLWNPSAPDTTSFNQHVPIVMIKSFLGTTKHVFIKEMA